MLTIGGDQPADRLVGTGTDILCSMSMRGGWIHVFVAAVFMLAMLIGAIVCLPIGRLFDRAGLPV
ncbi:MAG TPA: hypothetical protein VF756_29845 [Thermoanaerobaculia bacterium]